MCPTAHEKCRDKAYEVFSEPKKWDKGFRGEEWRFDVCSTAHEKCRDKAYEVFSTFFLVFWCKIMYATLNSTLNKRTLYEEKIKPHFDFWQGSHPFN